MMLGAFGFIIISYLGASVESTSSQSCDNTDPNIPATSAVPTKIMTAVNVAHLAIDDMDSLSNTKNDGALNQAKGKGILDLLCMCLSMDLLATLLSN